LQYWECDEMATSSQHSGEEKFLLRVYLFCSFVLIPFFHQGVVMLKENRKVPENFF